MKPGNVITCNNNMRWILIEEYENSVKVASFNGQAFLATLDKNIIINIEDFKVEWLFLARRKRDLKGLEKYV